MKRIFVLMIVVLLISLGLAACGPKTTPTDAPAVDQPATTKPTDVPVTKPTAAEPEVAEPVTLEYWQGDFVGWGVGIAEVIKMFEAENPNITVNYTPISYDEINEKIAAMVPVGQGPDVVNPFFGWVPLWAK